MDEQTREWKDRRVHELYTLVITSKNRAIRHEALAFLGAMERAGSEDAERALDAIRKLGSDPSNHTSNQR